MRNRIRLCALCIALSLVLILEPAFSVFARPLFPAFAEVAEEAPSPDGVEEPAPAAGPAEDEGGDGSEAELPPESLGDDPAPVPDADPLDAQDAPAEAIVSPEPEDAEAAEPSPLPSGDPAGEDEEDLTPPNRIFRRNSASRAACSSPMTAAIPT